MLSHAAQLAHGSPLSRTESCSRLQDAYAARLVPQLTWNTFYYRHLCLSSQRETHALHDSRMIGDTLQRTRQHARLRRCCSLRHVLLLALPRVHPCFHVVRRWMASPEQTRQLSPSAHPLHSTPSPTPAYLSPLVPGRPTLRVVKDVR